GYAEWHDIAAARWDARLHDHRMAMVGAGAVTLVLSVMLFGTLPQSFFPPQNSDYSRVNITMAPGSTLKETEAVVDRAAAVISNLAQPEITITPRLDLAADLGVTTAALSQTIRMATLGEIEQNSAKFSLSDRQVPIQVSLSESARRDLSTLENLPVPTSSGGSVPLKAVADIGFGSGPTTIQRSNQVRRLGIGADLAPGFVQGDVFAKVLALPTLKKLPQGVEQMNLGDQKWQA